MARKGGLLQALARGEAVAALEADRTEAAMVAAVRKAYREIKATAPEMAGLAPVIATAHTVAPITCGEMGIPASAENVQRVAAYLATRFREEADSLTLAALGEWEAGG